MTPVVHVDGWLIWRGGAARKMTLFERARWKLGLLKAVRW